MSAIIELWNGKGTHKNFLQVIKETSGEEVANFTPAVSLHYVGM